MMTSTIMQHVWAKASRPQAHVQDLTLRPCMRITNFAASWAAPVLAAKGDAILVQAFGKAEL